MRNAQKGVPKDVRGLYWWVWQNLTGAWEQLNLLIVDPPPEQGGAPPPPGTPPTYVTTGNQIFYAPGRTRVFMNGSPKPFEKVTIKRNDTEEFSGGLVINGQSNLIDNQQEYTMDVNLESVTLCYIFDGWFII